MDLGPLNILVTMPVDADGLARARASAGEATFDFVGPDTELSPDLLRDRHVLLGDPPPQGVGEVTSLRWIQLGSAGYEHLVGLGLAERGITVTTASGVNDVPIAEWCALMILSFERDLPRMLDLQAARRWERPARFQSEARGRRVGILGYGNLGRETARVCHSLGLEVWAMNRRPIGPRPLRYAPPGTGDPEGTIPSRRFVLGQMADFLPSLDYLVLTVALNEDSRALIGAHELALLSPSAVLLNPARAQLVDEEALVAALRGGRIAGAALDAHYREPMPPDDPFWQLPNVVATPHISGSAASPHYLPRVWELFALNLQRLKRGEPLLNAVEAIDLAGPA